MVLEGENRDQMVKNPSDKGNNKHRPALIAFRLENLESEILELAVLAAIGRPLTGWALEDLTFGPLPILLGCGPFEAFVCSDVDGGDGE